MGCFRVRHKCILYMKCYCSIMIHCLFCLFIFKTSSKNHIPSFITIRPEVWSYSAKLGGLYSLKKIVQYCSKFWRSFHYILFFILFYRLHGSYEAIEGGQTMDALVDLTGGLAERHIIQNKDPQLYRLIERARSSGAFITCSRKVCYYGLTRLGTNLSIFENFQKPSPNLRGLGLLGPF